MKLDLNKFYNTNYKDFVHKEAIEEALRKVAEIDLKDVEIDTILSITFSVDETGENPMYVEYLDKESKKHIVRIRPAVTNEIQEILKRYVTLEQHENDKQDIYNYFNTLNVPMEIRSENGLDDEGHESITMNNDNAFISFQVDPEKDDKIQWLCIQNHDGTLGPHYQYVARFMDYAKADEVVDNVTFLQAITELENKIHTGDETTLQEAKDYADTQDTTQRNEITALINQGDEDSKNEILSVIDVKYDDLKGYVDSKDSEYHELGKRYTDNAKQEAVSTSKTYTDNKADETLVASKNYTDSKHAETTRQVTELEENVNTNFARVTEVTPLTNKLSNVWGGHKAPFIYWLPNIDINTMKLENTENDVKVTLNDGDVVYWRKNAYQPVDLTNYYSKTESDSKFATKDELTTNISSLCDADQTNFDILNEKINAKTTIYTKNEGSTMAYYYPRVDVVTKTDGDIILEANDGDTLKLANLLNDEQLAKLKNLNNIENNSTKLSEIPSTGKVSYINWYPDTNVNYVRLAKDDEYVRAHINNSSTTEEEVVYLPKFKSAKESEVSALKTLVSSMGETQPIEMSVSYNGNTLELDNYSTFSTIGNTTMVNINCNFTAPFINGTTLILNALSISSETLKSFPTFMIDCIVKTATNVSSYTTTTVFSNKITNLYVETPVIKPNETIATTLISFNGSFIFQQ